MIKTTQHALILICLLCSACATLDRPFYYEIERGGQKSYVLGTAHTGFEARELPSRILTQLKESKAFASEVHTAWAEVDRKELVRKRYKGEWNQYEKNRKTDYQLSRLLTPEAWEYAQKILEKGQRDKVSYLKNVEIDKLTPYLAADFVSALSPRVVYVTRAQSYGLRNGFLDKELYQIAKKRDKIFVDLDKEESIDQSCRDRMNIVQLEWRARSGPDDQQYENDFFFYAYEKGDEAILERFANRTRDPEYDQCVLIDRNQRWAKVLDMSYEHFQPVFVAVGAGHLVGPKSLLNLLKEKGFSVRRVSFD